MHTLTATQQLPITMQQAWDFFSSPANLNDITPPSMSFIMLDKDVHLQKMYAGQILNYKVKPFLGIPMPWTTEITHVIDGSYFVDEQRFGPFAFWHHKHFFKEIPGGVLMEDVLHYKLPLGPLGDIAHMLFVKRQIADIFDYRFKKLEEMFGKM